MSTVDDGELVGAKRLLAANLSARLVRRLCGKAAIEAAAQGTFIVAIFLAAIYLMAG